MANHYPKFNPRQGDPVVTEIRQAPGEETRQMLNALQAAVHKCLERKRRLGQYAVVWKDGKRQRLVTHPTEPSQ